MRGQAAATNFAARRCLAACERLDFVIPLTAAGAAASAHCATALVPTAQDAAVSGDAGATAARLLDTLAFTVTNAVTCRQHLVRYTALRRACVGGAADTKGSRRLREGAVPENKGRDTRESLCGLAGTSELERMIVTGLWRQGQR